MCNKFREDKIIKKTLNTVSIVLAIFVLTMAALFFISQTGVVQNFVIKKITSEISEDINAKVSIGRVKFTFFRKIVLEDVFLSDQEKDTLLYTQKLVAGFDTLSFKKKYIHFKSISLVNPKVEIVKFTDNHYNFDFLFENNNKSQPSGSWNARSSNLVIKNGAVSYNDTTLNARIRELLNLKNLNLTLDNLRLTTGTYFSVNINKLSFLCNCGLEMNNFNTVLEYSDSIFTLKNVEALTAGSQLKIDSLGVDLKKYLIGKDPFSIKFDLFLKQLKLSPRDISYFLPGYSATNLDIGMSGHIYGQPGEIKGKDFIANLGDITRINADFYLNGLPNIDNTYIFVDLFESYANLNQLRKVQLPESLESLKSDLPKFLDNVGAFTYSGNFTGFINDFVAYGTAYSNLGSIESDVSFKPGENNMLKIKGHISTKNLQVGSIFRNDHLGKISLNGNINGSISDSLYNIALNGTVDSLDVNNYSFKNIDIQGNLRNKLFNGHLLINDPILKMDYTGNLDMSARLPVFNFVANVEYADLYKLKLQKDPVSKIALNIDANFVGNNIDNVEGRVKINNLFYCNSIDSLSLKNAVINNYPGKDTSLLTIKSDWIDAEIRGNYRLKYLSSSLTKFYQNYFPATFRFKNAEMADHNNFSFVFTVKNTEPFTRVFFPDIYVQAPFIITGYYNPTDLNASVETSIPYLRYHSKEIDKLELAMNADSGSIVCRIKTDNFHYSKNLSFPNLVIDSKGGNDSLDINLLWNNNNEITYSGDIHTKTTFKKGRSLYPNVNIYIEPSSFYLSDSLWIIDPATIQIDSSSVCFNDLTLHAKNQAVTVNGKISENPKDIASINMKDIDFKVFDPLLGESDFDGLLNGSADLSDIYHQFKMNLDLTLKDLSFEKSVLGDLELKSHWKNDIEKLSSNLTLATKDRVLINGAGFIDPVNDNLDLNLTMDKTPLTLLEMFVPDLFYDTEGTVDGNVHLSGRPSFIMLDGKLTPTTTAGVGIRYLKTHYYLYDPIYFKGDSLLFRNIRIEDDEGNKGVFDGSITQHNFNDMVYNLSISSNKIKALNTTYADNDQFYGTAYGSGVFTITGKDDEILLSGELKTEKGTTINIPYESKEEAEKYDFVQFVNDKGPVIKTESYNLVTNGLNMNFDIDVTPDAKVQIIFNSQFGEVIRGEGNGNLQVKVDKNYNIKLYGDYVIEKGEYLFTVQSIINKKFTIEKGGTMKWIGDPYDAQIDLTAVYRVKTSLYDLFAGTYQDADLIKRLPVDCIIKLRESMMKPTVDFSIDLPTADDRIKDEVNQLIVTKEDVNKQMLSLLAIGRFYTPEFFSGKPTTQTGTQLVGATASELFSSQLTSWLSQISDVWNIGINYRPGNEISDDQVELALSTQILNDKITIDGNIANNNNPNSSNSGELVGDFDVKIKLTKDGRLQFQAYNHSNDNLIYDTAPYTQGIGFSYREEFNTLKDLFQRYINAIFKKKKLKTKTAGTKIGQ